MYIVCTSHCARPLTLLHVGGHNGAFFDQETRRVEFASERAEMKAREKKEEDVAAASEAKVGHSSQQCPTHQPCTKLE